MSSLDQTLVVLSGVLALFSLLVSLLKYYKYSQVKRSIKYAKRDIENIGTLKIKTTNNKQNPRIQLITLLPEIEKEIREIGQLLKLETTRSADIINNLIQKGFLNEEWETSFFLLYKTRNNLFHGVSISDIESEHGLEIAVLLKAKLDEIKSRLSNNSFTFEIFQDEQKDFYWRLLSPTGELLATSEPFESVAEVKNNIKLFKERAKDFKINEVYEK